MKTTTHRDEIRDLFFRNEDATGLGDAGGLRGSAVAGSIYLSLHDLFPGLSGNQGSNEVAGLTGYVRLAIARTIAKWTQGTRQISNTDEETFAEITAGGPVTAFYIGLGDDSAGAGKLRYFVPIGSKHGAILGADTGDLVTDFAHGLIVDDRVAFHAVEGKVLPAGVVEGTVYFVGTAPGADTITLSTTAANGAPVVITADGAALMWKMEGILLNAGTEPKIKVGQLKVFFN